MAEPWDTGVWNKCLKFVAEGKAEAKNNMVAIERAKYILVLRGAVKLVSSPTKGKCFLFEEDLPHHINECYVLISTGIGISFFPNVHVRECLHQLNSAHRPLYQQKLLRLL